MVEWVGHFEASINDAGRKKRDFISTISPGIRAAAIDSDGLQVVLGLAAPIGLTRPADNYGVFLYLSVEHNFLE
jgi:hypothetical protein